MLTATGQNQSISHGLQIGKDRDDSSQDAEHGYHFNNILSCEKECSGANDEGIYEWERVRRLFVVNSRHLVLARIQTPQKLTILEKFARAWLKCCHRHANVKFSTLRATFFS